MYQDVHVEGLVAFNDMLCFKGCSINFFISPPFCPPQCDFELRPSDNENRLDVVAPVVVSIPTKPFDLQFL